jgi:hypothetical protein
MHPMQMLSAAISDSHDQRESRDIITDENLVVDRLQRAAGDYLLVEYDKRNECK